MEVKVALLEKKVRAKEKEIEELKKKLHNSSVNLSLDNKREKLTKARTEELIKSAMNQVGSYRDIQKCRYQISEKIQEISVIHSIGDNWNLP